MADDTRIYVNEQTFTTQINTMESGLNQLNSILGEYESLKDRARNVWGDEDENQRKAIEVCESAIQLVKQKIGETKNSKQQLENISQDAYRAQSDYGSKLDEAKAQIDALRQ